MPTPILLLPGTLEILQDIKITDYRPPYGLSEASPVEEANAGQTIPGPYTWIVLIRCGSETVLHGQTEA